VREAQAVHGVGIGIGSGDTGGEVGLVGVAGEQRRDVGDGVIVAVGESLGCVGDRRGKQAAEGVDDLIVDGAGEDERRVGRIGRSVGAARARCDRRPFVVSRERQCRDRTIGIVNDAFDKARVMIEKPQRSLRLEEIPPVLNSGAASFIAPNSSIERSNFDVPVSTTRRLNRRLPAATVGFALPGLLSTTNAVSMIGE
jgi:hypothetical protein